MQLKVDIGAKLDDDAALSMGESLVAIGKYDEQPGEYRESALLAALDPDVRGYLGL